MVHTVYSFSIHFIAIFITDISKQLVCLVHLKLQQKIAESNDREQANDYASYYYVLNTC